MLLNCGIGEDSWEPLDNKEIQPLYPEGNQSWIFIGRTDAEAETPKFWPPDAKNWLIGNDRDAGKDWKGDEKGMTEDEMDGWHHWLDGHELNMLQELLMDREAWKPGVLQSMGLQRVRHDWVTELSWIQREIWALTFIIVEFQKLKY